MFSVQREHSTSPETSLESTPDFVFTQPARPFVTAQRGGNASFADQHRTDFLALHFSLRGAGMDKSLGLYNADHDTAFTVDTAVEWLGQHMDASDSAAPPAGRRARSEFLKHHLKQPNTPLRASLQMFTAKQGLVVSEDLAASWIYQARSGEVPASVDELTAGRTLPQRPRAKTVFRQQVETPRSNLEVFKTNVVPGRTLPEGMTVAPDWLYFPLTHPLPPAKSSAYQYRQLFLDAYRNSPQRKRSCGRTLDAFHRVYGTGRKITTGMAKSWITGDGHVFAIAVIAKFFAQYGGMTSVNARLHPKFPFRACTSFSLERGHEKYLRDLRSGAVAADIDTQRPDFSAAVSDWAMPVSRRSRASTIDLEPDGSQDFDEPMTVSSAASSSPAGSPSLPDVLLPWPNISTPGAQPDMGANIDVAIDEMLSGWPVAALIESPPSEPSPGAGAVHADRPRTPRGNRNEFNVRSSAWSAASVTAHLSTMPETPVPGESGFADLLGDWQPEHLNATMTETPTQDDFGLIGPVGQWSPTPVSLTLQTEPATPGFSRAANEFLAGLQFTALLPASAHAFDASAPAETAFDELLIDWNPPVTLPWPRSDAELAERTAAFDALLPEWL